NLFAQFGLVFNGRIEYGDRLVGLVVVRILRDDALVSFDRFARFGDVLRSINAGFVLLVNDPGDEDSRSLVVRIDIQRALGVLLSLFEMAFSVGARRFVQLILGPDLVGERAAGTGSDKQSQDRCR